MAVSPMCDHNRLPRSDDVNPLVRKSDHHANRLRNNADSVLDHAS